MLREALAFYGDVDFIATESYSAEDSRQAMEEAAAVVAVAKLAIQRDSWLKGRRLVSSQRRAIVAAASERLAPAWGANVLSAWPWMIPARLARATSDAAQDEI